MTSTTNKATNKPPFRSGVVFYYCLLTVCLLSMGPGLLADECSRCARAADTIFFNKSWSHEDWFHFYRYDADDKSIHWTPCSQIFVLFLFAAFTSGEFTRPLGIAVDGYRIKTYVPAFLPISAWKAYVFTYLPSFLTGLAITAFEYGKEDPNFAVLFISVVLALHFGRRILEELFLFKHGKSTIGAESYLVISWLYASIVALCCFSTYYRTASAFVYTGMLMVLIGTFLNAYTHLLLGTLERPRGPDGRLQHVDLKTVSLVFNLFNKPHYVGEVMIWIGLAFLSQSPAALWYAGWQVNYFHFIEIN